MNCGMEDESKALTPWSQSTFFWEDGSFLVSQAILFVHENRKASLKLVIRLYPELVESNPLTHTFSSITR
jgi:hypothetical protein